MRHTRHTQMHLPRILCSTVCWFGVCLVVTACTTARPPTSASPTAMTSGGALVGAYRGHTSLVFAVV
jgi:hypothetical protein